MGGRFKKEKDYFSVDVVKEMIRKQPVRMAQRLLREYGRETEMMVEAYFPDIEEKKIVLFYIRQQKETWAIRNWNNGYVREY